MSAQYFIFEGEICKKVSQTNSVWQTLWIMCLNIN